MAGKQYAGQLRIVGGKWRGRKIEFAPEPGVRPTSDRIRETLFNWLQTRIVGARCLDLFSGSGALGFEALSRGAAEVVMIDHSRVVAQQLLRNATLLDADSVEIEQCRAARYLHRTSQPFDIVFLDPPFQMNVLETLCAQLETGGWLAPGSAIYIERAKESPAPQLPDNWRMHREKVAGEVCYGLAIRDESIANP